MADTIINTVTGLAQQTTIQLNWNNCVLDQNLQKKQLTSTVRADVEFLPTVNDY